MIGWIRRALTPDPVQFPAPRPEAPFYAVGDIHGRVDLLETLLQRLDPAHPVVFVGDYVDRGENSADVLRRLFELSANANRTVHCLMGNHEDMLLSFLDNPEKRGKAWLRNGGLQTLASFGVAKIAEATTGKVLENMGDALRNAMGPELIDWLRQRPLYWQSGNVAVVHAGADPEKPIKDQAARNLIWGHPAFRKTPRQDGVWVVHGHTIQEEPTVGNGTISIDTGAYATGCLTAVFVTSGSVEFVTT